MNKIPILISSILFTQITAETYNYLKQGQDWPGVCVNGLQQSPINIVDANLTANYFLNVALEHLAFKNYINATIQSTPQTVQSNITDGGYYQTFDSSFIGVEFSAQQIQIRSPSEHQWNGFNTDLELQIKSTYGNGTVGAIFSIFFDRSLGNFDNLFIEQWMPAFRAPVQTNVTVPNLMIKSLLNSLDISQIVSYDGSLTHPPCTEGIKWVLSYDVQQISDRQLHLIQSRWSNNATFANSLGNNRPIQESNGRKVYYFAQVTSLLTFWSATVGLAFFFALGLFLLILKGWILGCCPQCMGFHKIKG